MALGQIGSGLWTLVKFVVGKYGPRWVDENMGRGPNALSPLETDINKVRDEVYRYTATIRTAVVAAQAPRNTTHNSMSSCTYSYGTTEV